MRARDQHRPRGPLVTALVRNMTAHHTLLLANGVAFAFVLAIVPALMAVVALYGLVADPADVESNLEPLVEVMPVAAGELLITQLQGLAQVDTTQVTVGLMVALVGVLWALSNALNALVIAVRRAHEMPSPHNWLQGRWFAIKLSVVAVFASTAMLWFVVVLPELLRRWRLGGVVRWAIAVGRWPAVVLIAAAAVAILYRLVLGRRPSPRSRVSAGAVVSTALWVASSLGLRLVYTQIGQVESTLGTLSAVAALMIWIYLSAVSALVGAEIDAVLHPLDASTPAPG